MARVFIIIGVPRSQFGLPLTKRIAKEKQKTDTCLIITSRSQTAAKLEANKLKEEFEIQVLGYALDIAQSQSIVGFVHHIQQMKKEIEGIIIVSGTGVAQKNCNFLGHTINYSIAVNALGPILLLEKLKESIKKQKSSCKIAIVASESNAHIKESFTLEDLLRPFKKNPSMQQTLKTYALSKLVVILYAKWSLVHPTKNISIRTFHPGKMPGSQMAIELKGYYPFMDFVGLPLISLLDKLTKRIPIPGLTTGEKAATKLWEIMKQPTLPTQSHIDLARRKPALSNLVNDKTFVESFIPQLLTFLNQK